MSNPREYFDSIRAKDVMTHDVVTVYANQQMSTAVEDLLQHRISGVPVVSYEGTCVGILSSIDFLTQEEFGDKQVVSFMTSPAITVSENHTLLEVAGILRSRRIHRVPVVDDRGCVTGILSTLDIVDHLVQAMDIDTEVTIS